MMAKRPYHARLYVYGTGTFAEALGSVPEEKWNGKVPTVRGVLPDGREVFLTFENTHSDTTSRDEYTRRMRALARAILAEADRRDSDPNR